MKRFVFLFLSIISVLVSVKAQTFTQHLQQNQAGKGKVSISQSREIDALVNGTIAQSASVEQAQKQTIKKNTNTNTKASVPATATKQSATAIAAKKDSMEKARLHEQEGSLKAQKAQKNAVEDALALQRRIAEKTAEEKRKEAEEKRQLAETKRQSTEQQKAIAEEEAEAELHIPTVDMRKKVMRGARKVTGYRVQAFAGGNTRADKTKAQQAGNDIKMRFPDQPIYVHFYSPRWICRVGNYRSLGEARRMLSAIKGMGYKAAVIVKGQITVFD